MKKSRFELFLNSNPERRVGNAEAWRLGNECGAVRDL